MTWKFTTLGQNAEFPTDELWVGSFTAKIYRRTFRMTHPATMSTGSSYNTTFPGAGHGVGTMLRAELWSATPGGWSGLWHTIDVQRQSATILTLVPSYNIGTIQSGANSIYCTLWYTKETGIS